MWRENFESLVDLRGSGEEELHIGRGTLLTAPVRTNGHFRRLTLSELPTLVDHRQSLRLGNAALFRSGLKRCFSGLLAEDSLANLISDFDNSFSNLVLNNLLFAIGQDCGRSSEFCRPGHSYYPFPALRVGPSIDDIEACSNLTGPVSLPVYGVEKLVFRSEHFASASRCNAAWSGLSCSEGNGNAVPIHPWQLSGSPYIQGLISSNAIACVGHVAATTLASQRTLRIVATGFDIKLPVNATLTGEHRLLYGLNRSNAVATSTLIDNLIEADKDENFGIQPDIAVLEHPEPRTANHLSAIIRSPIRPNFEEEVMSALVFRDRVRSLSLYVNEERFSFLQLVYDYCRLVIGGPLKLYCRWGAGLEPHLQNTLLVLRGGRVVRVLVRDLDGATLWLDRVDSICRAKGIRFEKGTRESMPSAATAGRRLAHSLVFGHIAEIILSVSETARIDIPTITDCFEDAWADVVQGLSHQERIAAKFVRAQVQHPKEMLKARLSRHMISA